MDTNLVSKDAFENREIFFFKLKKKNWIFFSIFKSVKSPSSGKENIWFLDSPDLENLPDFGTGRDVR